MNKKSIIYLVGISIFGFFYYRLSSLIESDFIFIGLSVVYLLVLRLLAEYLGKDENQSD